VQVDPIKPKLKPPGTKRLKLKCDTLLSTSAFKFKLRRYNGVWTRLVDIPDTIPQAWSTYPSAAAGDGVRVLYRRLRLRTAVNGARCRLAEMRVFGAVRHTTAGESPSCGADVVVTAQGVNGGDEAVHAVAVSGGAGAGVWRCWLTL